MQIGVTVGFVWIDDALFVALNVKFNHPRRDVRGEVSGSLPFLVNRSELEAGARQMIRDSYPDVVIPPNATMRVIGI